MRMRLGRHDASRSFNHGLKTPAMQHELHQDQVAMKRQPGTSPMWIWAASLALQ